MNKEEAKNLIVSLLSDRPKSVAEISKEVSELNLSRSRLYDLLNQLTRDQKIVMVPAPAIPKNAGRSGRYPSRAYILPDGVPLQTPDASILWRIMYRAGRAETIVAAPNKLEALRSGQKKFNLNSTRPLRAIRITARS